MNVLICGTLDSSAANEELDIVNELAHALTKQGYIVDVFMLPFNPYFKLIPEQIVAMRLFNIHFADILITIGYPALFISHPRKSSYLFETPPMLHEFQNNNPEFDRVKNAVIEAERRCLHETGTIVCSSLYLQNELQEHYGILSECYAYEAATIDNLVKRLVNV